MAEAGQNERTRGDWADTFLKALARTGIVSRACKLAKVARSTAYTRYDNDKAFADLWEDAMEQAVDALENEAWRRAMKGTKRPILHQGKIVAYVKEYSDGLLLALLKAHRRERFGSLDELAQIVAKALEARKT